MLIIEDKIKISLKTEFKDQLAMENSLESLSKMNRNNRNMKKKYKMINLRKKHLINFYKIK